jgi:hypothetical protein
MLPPFRREHSDGGVLLSVDQEDKMRLQTHGLAGTVLGGEVLRAAHRWNQAKLQTLVPD